MIIEIPFDELLSDSTVAAGMFHLPAQPFDAQLFRVEIDAGFFQFMADDFQVFILGRRGVMKDESETV